MCRFGRNTLVEDNHAKGHKRTQFLADVRKEQRFTALYFIYEIFEVSPPPTGGRNLQNVEFADLGIPLSLSSYTASLLSVVSILQPSQEMVNEISEALAKAEACPPPHKPYISPEYTARPWLPIMSMRTSALAKWRARVSRVPAKREISPQMRMRRHFRFIIDADLRRAWDPFGGLAAQLSHVEVILSLASTENCNCDMTYQKELVRFLPDSARARMPIDFRNYLSEIKDAICQMATREDHKAPTYQRPHPASGAPRGNGRKTPLRTNDPSRVKEKARLKGRGPEETPATSPECPQKPTWW